jgi:hypothetical protein
VGDEYDGFAATDGTPLGELGLTGDTLGMPIGLPSPKFGTVMDDRFGAITVAKTRMTATAVPITERSNRRSVRRFGRDRGGIGARGGGSYGLVTAHGVVLQAQPPTVVRSAHKRANRRGWLTRSCCTTFRQSSFSHILMAFSATRMALSAVITQENHSRMMFYRRLLLPVLSFDNDIGTAPVQPLC